MGTISIKISITERVALPRSTIAVEQLPWSPQASRSPFDGCATPTKLYIEYHLCVMGNRPSLHKFGVSSDWNISASTGRAPAGCLIDRVSTACGTSSQASLIALGTDRQLSGRDIRLRNLYSERGDENGYI